MCVADVVAEQANNAHPAHLPTIAEIIVCILVAEDRRLALDDIITLACRRFLALNIETGTQIVKLEDHANLLRYKFSVALHSYYYHFLKVCDRWKTYNLGDVSMQATTFSSTGIDAHIVLNGRLRARAAKQSQAGPLQIPELPQEIISMILEYLLILPDSGVMIIGDDLEDSLPVRNFLGPRTRFAAAIQRPRQLHVLTRDPSEKKSLAAWKDSNPGVWPNYMPPYDFKTFTEPLPTFLAPMLVNKTTTDACLALFYSRNRFHESSVEKLLTLINALAPSRAKLLRKVSFVFDCHARRFASELFDKLRSLGVKSLRIGITRHDWKGLCMSKIHGRRAPGWKFDDPSKIVGMKALCEFDGDAEIEVEGDWKEFAQYLRDNGGMGKVLYNGKEVEWA